MELLKDYDCTIEHHPGKANIVADALSWKSTGNLYYIRATKVPMLIELRKLNVELNINVPDCILATLKVRPLLMERIAQAQLLKSAGSSAGTSFFVAQTSSCD